MNAVNELLVEKIYNKQPCGIGIKINLYQDKYVSTEIWMKVYKQLPRIVFTRTQPYYYIRGLFRDIK